MSVNRWLPVSALAIRLLGYVRMPPTQRSAVLRCYRQNAVLIGKTKQCHPPPMLVRLFMVFVHQRNRLYEIKKARAWSRNLGSIANLFLR